MRRHRHFPHHRRTPALREHRLCNRASEVASAYSRLCASHEPEAESLLDYAERLVAFEGAWDALLQDLSA